ncbi:MAG: hypothetical protein HY663_03805 [Chloroflexi bacterium]|nr:hypothetical protein [Chloroflexota bacterium]
MSQPGVVHIEFHWPEKMGVLIYDSNRTTAEDVVSHIKESNKRELTVVTDRPFP